MIKYWFAASNGIMSLKERPMQKATREIFKEIGSEPIRKTQKEDKKNMREDGKAFKNDVQKAVDAYYKEFSDLVNG